MKKQAKLPQVISIGISRDGRVVKLLDKGLRFKRTRQGRLEIVDRRRRPIGPTFDCSCDQVHPSQGRDCDIQKDATGAGFCEDVGENPCTKGCSLMIIPGGDEIIIFIPLDIRRPG